MFSTSASRKAMMDAMMHSYIDTGASPGFIMYAILVNIVAWVGIALNLLLFYITLREKSLRGSTNYLLGLHAFLEVLHETGHIPLLYIVISGQNFVTYATATRYVSHALFGFVSALAAMTSIAVDRLLIVVIPFRHIQLDGSWRYRMGHTAFILLAGCIGTGGVILYAIQNPSELVSGTLNSLLEGDLAYFWIADALNCLLEVAIYALIWFFTKKALGNSGNSGEGGHTGSAASERIQRSLIWIVTVNVGCQLVGAVIVIVTEDLLYEDVNVLEGGNALGSIILNIGSASCLPILYIISEEYREATKRHIRPLKRLILFWRRHPQEQGHSSTNGGGAPSSQIHPLQQVGGGGVGSARSRTPVEFLNGGGGDHQRGSSQQQPKNLSPHNFLQRKGQPPNTNNNNMITVV